MSETLLLENKIPIEESKFWSLQDNLFQNETLDSHYFPLSMPDFHHTRLAHELAFLTYQFMVTHSTENHTEPFLFLDLFPGNGKFAFNFLSYLSSLIDDSLSFTYLMRYSNPKNFEILENVCKNQSKWYNTMNHEQKFIFIMSNESTIPFL